MLRQIDTLMLYSYRLFRRFYFTGWSQILYIFILLVIDCLIVHIIKLSLKNVTKYYIYIFRRNRRKFLQIFDRTAKLWRLACVCLASSDHTVYLVKVPWHCGPTFRSIKVDSCSLLFRIFQIKTVFDENCLFFRLSEKFAFWIMRVPYNSNHHLLFPITTAISQS